MAIFNLQPLLRFFCDQTRDGDSIHRVHPLSPYARGNHASEYGAFLTVDKFFLLPCQILLCVYLNISFTKKQIFYLLFTKPSFCRANQNKCQANNQPKIILNGPTKAPVAVSITCSLLCVIYYYKQACLSSAK